MTRPQATATLLFENERLRSTRFDFAPGAETGWHVHGLDYVITTLTPCAMLVEQPGGATLDARFEAGECYGRARGTEHNVVNAGEAAMSFVELELK